MADTHGYAMRWDSFTSSSRGNISGYKIQQVFSHAGQVGNIFQLTLKKTSSRSARKGSHGKTVQIHGGTLLPSTGAGASRSVWELIHWHLQKGGTCYKLCWNTAGLTVAVQWSPDSSPKHDLLRPCLNSEPNGAFSPSFPQTRRDQGASDPGPLSTGMFGYSTVSRDP